MKSKEDCPYRWLSCFCFAFTIVLLYYSFSEYATLYGVYKVYFAIDDFDFHYNFVLSMQYLFLFSVVLFIGVITDKYGPGFTFLVQTIAITIGQLLVYLSVLSKFFYLMYPGRVLIVIGCSSMAISKGVFCRDYFLSDHLALTNSITSMSFNLAAIANLFVVWRVYKSYDLLACELFALFLCIVGLILVLIIYKIDVSYNKYFSLYNYQTDYQNINDIDNINKQVQEEKPSAIKEYIQDIKQLKSSYWLGCFSAAIALISTNVYIVLGPAILQQYLNLTPQQSSFYASFLPNSTLIMPLIGRLIDHYKSWFNTYYIISFLSISGSLLLIFNVPSFAFIAFGLSYGTRTSSEFPLIQYLVEKKIAGRAYSITRAFCNVALSLMLFLNSMLTKYTGSYFYILLVIIVTSTLISVFITLVKIQHNKEKLNPIEQNIKLENTQQQQKI